jgi:hypothetical protein
LMIEIGSHDHRQYVYMCSTISSSAELLYNVAITGR